MAVTGFNHVSVSADDLAESVRFYTEVLGLEPIATPDFGFPVQWLRLGDLQLHIFERPGEAPLRHHFALNVDDFEHVYRTAKALGIADDEAFGSDIYLLPDGAVQMYLRDPAGNLIEVDWPDVTTLDPDLAGSIRPLPRPQTGEAANATLYLTREPRR